MSGRRRSFVLIVVLVLGLSALLVATATLSLIRAEAAGVSESAGAMQARATTWSGIQVVMRRLAAQRDTLLDGDLPRLKR